MPGGSVDKAELTITSLQNPRIKEALHLWDRKHRNETDLFLIEGYRELLRASDAGWEIIDLFYCPELFLGVNENTLIAKLVKNGVKSLPCKEAVFRKLSYRDRPDGLIAIAKQKHLALTDLDKLHQIPFLVVAEAIEKPGNLGTILRSSDAVGADGVIVADPCTDIFNPNVVRASVGTLFTIPVIQASSLETIKWLKQKGIAILAATPSATVEYTKVDLTGPLSIAVGTEQLGLSEMWMKEADIQVKIPMRGVADSLNVAMATTLFLYEALRQRDQKHAS
jgi:TrmH family RNA methyltransferase